MSNRFTIQDLHFIRILAKYNKESKVAKTEVKPNQIEGGHSKVHNRLVSINRPPISGMFTQMKIWLMNVLNNVKTISVLKETSLFLRLKILIRKKIEAALSN